MKLHYGQQRLWYSEMTRKHKNIPRLTNGHGLEGETRRGLQGCEKRVRENGTLFQFGTEGRVVGVRGYEAEAKKGFTTAGEGQQPRCRVVFAWAAAVCAALPRPLLKTYEQ